MINLVKIVGLISVIGLLPACGDSGGVPATAPSATLAGTVTDAVITNGSIRVYNFENGQQAELIAQTMTDGNGDFEIADFTSQDRAIAIEVSGGRYTEEASGVSVELLGGQALRAYVFYEQGSAMTLQVTPFTHMASCLADYKIRSGVNVNKAITEATSVFSGLAGVDILRAKPVDITDPNNADFELTDNLRYGAVLAAISSYTAEVSEINGVTPHRFNQNSSIYATQVLCQDISADGVFNGFGFINNANSVGQLSLGSVSLDVDTLRSKVAQHILSIIGSDRNQTNLGVNDFVLYANAIASSTAGIFGGMPASAVDQVGPTVTAALAPDSFLKGIVNLDFVVSDPIGVKSVQFYVNDVPHSTGQVDAPVLSINSTNYTDGVIKITVEATDILNNISNIEFNYVIDNTSPTVSLTSARLVNNQVYTASGTYQEQGASVASIRVNGVAAAIDTDTQTWSANVTLLSGDNVLTLDINDAAANTNTVDIKVAVDLIPPTVSPNATQTTFTTFQGQLNLCNAGLFDDASAKDNPVCVSADNVSLNGALITGGLQNQGYLMLSFQSEDPQGAGVFTGSADLSVEYCYSIDGEEKVSWTPVPSPPGGTTYYLPMVTEYMGSDWYQVANNKSHNVVIRVTDNAGNSKSLTWVFKTDILVPEMVVESVIDDSLFVASTFANRTGIDGAGIDVTYNFSNASNTSFLISLNDAQLHSVKHTYESSIRENQARVRVSENWSALACSDDWKYGCRREYDISVSSVNTGSSTIYPSSDLFSTYQAVTSDSPVITDISGVPTITQLAGYTCGPGYTNYSNEWRTKAYANGNKAYGVCRYYDSENTGAGNAFNRLVGSVTKNIEVKPGYPRNNINAFNIDYVVNTEFFTVTNETLGQTILPIGSWYSIPPQTAISIIKTTRMPVVNHFFDDLSAVTYTLKKEDKTTTWTIDTDLTITRVIDPGNIQDVNNVTSSTSTVGSGLFQKTISRY